ncbi:MAG: NGG1p interacting factor NIF3 [Elusimicrobiota bacterium]|jgi:putative NIF3 family GTP cyclohydrolase 1 type 2|nr:NGG1p interacting factor NIF3 [Elusimicrobiota bacterium]
MKIKDIYNFFIEAGIEADPRGKTLVDSDLKKRKRRFEALKETEKNNFDKESLTNPYYDSRIIYGDEEIEVKTAIVGIDVETPEVLLASKLKEMGKSIDLIIAHHPEGFAYSSFANVIYMQSDILNKAGVPINISEKLVSERAGEVSRSVYPQNNERVSEAAKLLNIPFMNVHTPADNCAVSFLQKGIDAVRPAYLWEILEFLNKQPEYIYASKAGQPPIILNGNKDSRCGKVFVDMTGGTEGPIQSLEHLSQAGIGTIVGMHMSEKALKEAERCKINVLLAGHISSDNLGLNILFDKMESKLGVLELLEFSGFKRFKRPIQDIQ